ncbi:MAG: anti-sigma factor antagonist [Solirubrobacteraceae bacterium]|jgi:anti-sigma B factor antagonist|nr:anti-sigma factor antagonist [Solirubrobacteraceae bacterium]
MLMSAGNFAVAIGRTSPVVVLTATGEMDAATVSRLDAVIDEAISEHGCHVVLDAAAVTFVDSTGITSLISGLRRLNRSRRRLALAFPAGGPLHRALEVTGLDHTFECHPSVDDAVSALDGAPLIGR